MINFVVVVSSWEASELIEILRTFLFVLAADSAGR
jgi:hypothetical protein